MAEAAPWNPWAFDPEDDQWELNHLPWTAAVPNAWPEGVETWPEDSRRFLEFMFGIDTAQTAVDLTPHLPYINHGDHLWHQGAASGLKTYLWHVPDLTVQQDWESQIWNVGLFFDALFQEMRLKNAAVRFTGRPTDWFTVFRTM